MEKFIKLFKNRPTQAAETGKNILANMRAKLSQWSQKNQQKTAFRTFENEIHEGEGGRITSDEIAVSHITTAIPPVGLNLKRLDLSHGYLIPDLPNCLQAETVVFHDNLNETLRAKIQQLVAAGQIKEAKKISYSEHQANQMRARMKKMPRV